MENKVGNKDINTYEERISDVAFFMREEAQIIEKERKELDVIHAQAVEKEWKNASKRILIKNSSAFDIGETLPWEDILLFSLHGKISPFQMTQGTYIMTGIKDSVDRLSYETKDHNTVITVQKNRILIELYGSRKRKKIRKEKAIQMITSQLSAYYDAIVTMQYKKVKNAYVIFLK